MLSFSRRFHAVSTQLKRPIDLVEKAGRSIPKLKATPNLYNPKSSAHNYRGVMRAKIEPGLYHHPSQSLSTGSINSETIPKAFLPSNDPRRQFLDDIRSGDQVQAQEGAVLCASKDKTYHLEPNQIAEIIALRAENPEKYTRKALAKQFNVSPLFISLVSSASTQRKAEMAGRLHAIKQQWHPKRTLARDDRKKRKELWYRA
ncbi:LAMI_0H10110g1_1 [Lachancea mirantina]|uniref:LAMI_0H10110g1_1 n=1 Tax=Lachancea mirantina TaxID=1230905 RepID=A0A1G4KGQ0_9SACH|nr:LAMI_0H10110g1_1 [Lachancea mirantina]